MRGVTPSFFTPSLNLISVMRPWQYSNTMLNKLLLSALLFRPLIHLIIIDTTATIKIPTIVLTLLLMLIPWALRDLEINMCRCKAGVTCANTATLSNDDEAQTVKTTHFQLRLIILRIKFILSYF